jgi:hypothetical protein
MGKRLRGRLTYANVMASIAVFLSMSGGAYALTIPTNSVGSRQLRSKAVTRAKLATNAVTSTSVRDGSLRARDFRSSDLPNGPRGARGAIGSRGATGARGATGLRGLTGPRGESGLDPVPSGRTIRGVVGANFEAPTNATTETYGVDVTLPVPAANALGDAQVAVNAGATGLTPTDPNAGCTGTAAAPTAPAGILCIYLSAATNAATPTGSSVLGSAAGSPYGFKLTWNNAGAIGDTSVDGTWAYTAP